MRKTITRVALVATLATSLVASFAAAANAVGTGTNTAQSNGSDAALVLYNSVGQVRSVFARGDELVTAGSVSGNVNSTIDCPTGSVSTPQVFASTRGNEKNPANWTAYADTGYSAGTSILQANLTLSAMTNGANKGDLFSGTNRNFSLGVACFNGSTLTKVFYRYITIDSATPNAWTAAASDYSYPTPTITDNHSTNPLHTGDTLTASVGLESAIPSGFNVTYQWYAGGNLIASATNSTYTLQTNDGGLTFTVKAYYTDSTLQGRTQVTRESLPTATVQGDTNQNGTVQMNASVVAATNGQLSLSFVAAPGTGEGTYARSVSLTGALNGSNQSVSTGNLPDIKVSDGRVTTLSAWTLQASMEKDFGRVTGQTVSTTDLILKSALGITPTVFTKPDDRVVTAGTARTSGQAYNSAYVLASTAAVTDPGNDGSKVYTGDTVVKTALSLLAPQWKTAGNYQSTMTLALIAQ
jgi:hypothetical protein